MDHSLYLIVRNVAEEQRVTQETQSLEWDALFQRDTASFTNIQGGFLRSENIATERELASEGSPSQKTREKNYGNEERNPKCGTGLSEPTYRLESFFKLHIQRITMRLIIWMACSMFMALSIPHSNRTNIGSCWELILYNFRPIL